MKSVVCLTGLATIVGVFALGHSKASAHARLVDPKPRNNSTQYKNEAMACGGQPARSATQPLTMLSAGSKIVVKFEETVDHPGCFLIDFSANGDTNWQELANVKHVGTPPNPSDARPRPYMKEVTLPNTPCTACTIRVRQVMMESRGGEAAPCPPMPLGNTPTYFSCANVVLNASGGTADAGPDGATGTDMGGAGGSSGGTGGSGGAGGSGGSGGIGGAAGSGGSGGTGGSTGGSGGSTGGSTGGSSSGTGGSTGGSGSGTGGSSSGTGGSGSAGRGGSSGSGTGGSGSNPPSGGGSAGGCSVGGGQPSVMALGFAALVVGLALRGRRRRR